MAGFEELKIQGIDHLELAVNDLEKASEIYFKLGFEKAGARELRERQLRSYLFVQNEIQLLVTASAKSTDPVATFIAAHGEGVFDVAFLCEDAVSTLELCTGRGAQLAEPPRSYQKETGSVQQASIAAFGGVRHTFISRKGNLFAEGFEPAPRRQCKGIGISAFSSIQVTVETGKQSEWEEFYRKVFGKNFFVIQEPNEPHCPVQEFLDVNHGAGISKVVLHCPTFEETLPALRKAGLEFTEVSPARALSPAIHGPFRFELSRTLAG